MRDNPSSLLISNNPSTIDEGQRHIVSFPNIGPHDVIVPGTARLSFRITLESDTDANRTIVNNLGRAIITKIVIRLDGREIQSIDDADVFYCYSDLWLTDNERSDMVAQGLHTENICRLRIDAGNKDATKPEDVIVAQTHSNRFCIPLDFELLTAHLPYHQGALSDRLSYELTFNSYSRVIKSTDTDASYSISSISLEYDIVTHAELSRQIQNQYQSRIAIYYDRIIRHRMDKDNTETLWNFNLNTPARSFKGILMLFESATQQYQRDTEKFINPKIKKISVIIEGKPNQIFASGMMPYNHFDEIRKVLGGGKLRTSVVDHVSKDLHQHSVRLSDYLVSKYALFLDLRTVEDSALHGSGRRIENGADGITIHMERTAGSAGSIKIYMYSITDAQLNIENGRLKDVVY